LRKAGLGLLSNLPGDEKAVAVIEDTAVDVNDLPEFIKEFNEILELIICIVCIMRTLALANFTSALSLI
jgi:hypothetical protein